MGQQDDHEMPTHGRTSDWDWLSALDGDGDGARRREVGTGLALEMDPDLGADLTAEERKVATRECRVEVVRLAPGPWEPRRQTSGSIFALVLLDGMLLCQTTVGRHERVELLCGGDVFLPPADGEESALTAPTVTSAVLAPVRMMVLGPSYLQAAARWPSLLTRVRERVVRQQMRVVAQGLALQEARAEDRILLTFWYLGERCGRVTPEGLMLPLEFTHESLSRITAARRPTVSLALKRLQAGGLVVLRGDGRTVLTRRSAEVVAGLTARQQASAGSTWTLVPPGPLKA